MQFASLDKITRSFMLAEFEKTVARGPLYEGRRLTQDGISAWAALLREAIVNNDATWLADQLEASDFLKSHEERRYASGKVSLAKVPSNAAAILAEGEFNRFYCRGVCARSLSEGKESVEVYRAKDVSSPRPESEAKIGALVNAAQLLADLVNSAANPVDAALGIPSGPNSGLSVRLSN